MAVSIPLEPSRSPYTVSCALGDFNVMFDVRWNARDGASVADGGPGGAWYFDLYDDDDGSLIAAGLKIVLGVNIGRTSMHSFFDDRILHAFDTSGQGKEATFDDIGRRVQLVAIDMADPLGT